MQTVLPVEVALLSAFVQCYCSVVLGFVEQRADISGLFSLPSSTRLQVQSGFCRNLRFSDQHELAVAFL